METSLTKGGEAKENAVSFPKQSTLLTCHLSEGLWAIYICELEWRVKSLLDTFLFATSMCGPPWQISSPMSLWDWPTSSRSVDLAQNLQISKA